MDAPPGARARAIMINEHACTALSTRIWCGSTRLCCSQVRDQSLLRRQPRGRRKLRRYLRRTAGGDEPPRESVAEHRWAAGNCRVWAAASGVPRHPGAAPSAACLPSTTVCCRGSAAHARMHRQPRRARVPAHAVPPAVDARVQRDMVRLRLQRMGVRNNPFYRIVAADARSPRDGKHLELLGSAPGPCATLCAAHARRHPLACSQSPLSDAALFPAAPCRSQASFKAMPALTHFLSLQQLRLSACSRHGLCSSTTRSSRLAMSLVVPRGGAPARGSLAGPVRGSPDAPRPAWQAPTTRMPTSTARSSSRSTLTALSTGSWSAPSRRCVLNTLCVHARAWTQPRATDQLSAIRSCLGDAESLRAASWHE